MKAEDRPLASRERIEKLFNALLKMLKTKAFTTRDLVFMERFLHTAWLTTYQLLQVAQKRKEAS